MPGRLSYDCLMQNDSVSALACCPDMALAGRLFDHLREASFDGVGITRDTYGAGEQRAHDLMAQTAKALGLEVATDAALNLYMTLPGTDRSSPVVMTGSHLDSVPRGGNFDGAAGGVAGLAALAGWRRAGFLPRHDVTVMGIRAEESAWFPMSYIGSKAAFGGLPPKALDLRRADDGRTLADSLAKLGGSPERVRRGEAYLRSEHVACFVELHIEQGPVLIESGDVLGIVSGICGSLRYRHAAAVGQYAHSGATPRSHRHDAVVAVSELIHRLQGDWAAQEASGDELTLTFGRCLTDPVQSDFSKVAGRMDFSIDIRSREPAALRRMDAKVQEAVAEIAHDCGVRFELGEQSGSSPAHMDAGLRNLLRRFAAEHGFMARSMPSGAGHDSAWFANQGVPTAMIFVRNAHGSHNPDESMALEDFAQGAQLLSDVLATQAASPAADQR